LKPFFIFHLCIVYLAFLGSDALLGDTEREPFLILKTQSGFEYRIPNHSPTAAGQVAFEALSDQQQLIFLQNRIGFLNLAKASITWAHYPLGILFRQPRRIRAPTDNGKLVIESILSHFDQRLWECASLVARSNELGFMFELGTGGGAAIGSAGPYGLIGLGVTLNYNFKLGTARIEFYETLETLIRARPATGFLGIYGGLGPATYYHDPDAELAPETGQSFAGPGPIIGSYSSGDSHQRMHVAGGLGIGLSVPIIGELASVQTRLKTVPIVSISVHRNSPFIKIKTGFLPFIRTNAQMAAHTVKQLAIGCRAIYSRLKR